ncbi:hypothetical protein [Streptomyces brasiliensis]|nr:hypothetical protein [Streptomyces brasiliensis]
MQHAHIVTQTVRETLKEWQTRPSVLNEAAVHELVVACAARDVTALW